MPQASEELRQKFNFPFTDGIQEAEKVITDAGYIVDEGSIIIPTEIEIKGDLWDACKFLIDEWDYGFGH